MNGVNSVPGAAPADAAGQLGEGDGIMNRKRSPGWLLTLGLVLLGELIMSGASLGQGGLDPIRELQRALKQRREMALGADLQTLERLNEKIVQGVQKLHRLTDLRRAMELELDPRERKIVADRLTRGLRQVLQKGSDVARRAALTLIGDMGEKGVATVLTEEDIRLDRRDERGYARTFSADLVALIRAPNTAVSVRTTAAHACSQILPDPSVVVPALKEMLQYQNAAERQAAADALADIVINLIRLQQSAATSVGVRTDPQDVLAAAVQILPAARVGLADNDFKVRRSCIKALEQIGEFRLRQADLPAAFAPPAGQMQQLDFQPLLKEANELMQSEGFLSRLQDPDPIVRLLARRTLELYADARLRIQRRPLTPPGGPRPPFPPLLRNREMAPPPALRFPREQQNIQVPVPETLNTLKPVRFQQLPPAELADELLPGIQKASLRLLADLADPDVRVRRDGLDFLELAASALVKPSATAGAEQEPAFAVVAALVSMPCDPDPFVRWIAARVLAHIGMAQIEELAAEQDALPTGVAAMLQQIEQGLVSRLNDPDLDARISGAMGLNGVASEIKRHPSTPALQEALRIIQQGTPALVKAAGLGDPEPRVAMLEAIQVVGVSSAEMGQQAVTALIPLLSHDDTRVRATAAITLGSLGAYAASAIPALETALQDDEEDVRRAAADALLNIQTPEQD